ncbi:hypothetical protein J2Z42_000680 [Clostridium algifaecis]|uniref:Uncharacterized protein n=1 Tax=Clostridium algifaecis TaxID=1472040 RepID=A0ABS4KQZ2_9CLOT|nr:hypothetical protein [Clostridium algifaecis]
MESVWNSEANFRRRESLNKDIQCDIIITRSWNGWSSNSIYA